MKKLFILFIITIILSSCYNRTDHLEYATHNYMEVIQTGDNHIFFVLRKGEWRLEKWARDRYYNVEWSMRLPVDIPVGPPVDIEVK